MQIINLSKKRIIFDFQHNKFTILKVSYFVTLIY